MEKVIINQTIHNQVNIVLFNFNENETLLNTLKDKIQGFHWNTELQSWTSPYYPSLKKELFQLLRGRYWLDYSGMELNAHVSIVKTQVTIPTLAPLSEEHKIELKKFKNYLLSKRYSPSTINIFRINRYFFTVFHL